LQGPDWYKKHARHVKHTGKRLEHLNQRLAYMGMDWYTVVERRKQLSYLFIVQNLYYWCYTAYIVATVIVGAILIWAFQPEGGMTLAQAIYTSAACVSQSGLSVVDWSTRSNTTYVISFCLILLGSAPLLHCVPVILREHSFRMQTQMTARLQHVLSEAQLDETPAGHQNSGALRRCMSEPAVELPNSPPQSKSAVAGDVEGSPTFGVLSCDGTASWPQALAAAAGVQSIDDGPAATVTLDVPRRFSDSTLDMSGLSSSDLHPDAVEAPNVVRVEVHVTRTPPAEEDEVVGPTRPQASAGVPRNATLATPAPATLQVSASPQSTAFAADVEWRQALRQASRGSQAYAGHAEAISVKPQPIRHKHSDALVSAHRLEYKALRMILKIVIGYWFVSHLLGFAIFYSYFKFFTGEIQDKFYAEGLRAAPHALYLTVSAFQNNGLVMTPSSVMDFAKSPILLNTIGALVVLGNTGLPIMVRFIVAALERSASPGSDRQRILDFLLEHPRRCFTHMFPAVHTLWLLLVIVALNAAVTIVILWQDSSSPAMEGMSPLDKFWNALFQAVSCRTAGLNSVDIAYLSQGSTFLISVMMYLATTPTVVTMRFSAVAGTRGQTELDITGRVEGVDEEIIKGDSSLKAQARRYLTQDVTYLTLVIFFICCLEKDQFVRSAKDISPDSDGIYGDFTFFKVVFELASAYGTCGLSLGYQNQTASFSGMWCTTSQMLLVGVMILGRLRGLPDSIDPSVRVAMSDQVDGPERRDERRFIHA